MWIFRYARFIRVNQGGKRWSARSLLLLPIVIPILIAQVVVIGFVVIVLLFITISIPRTFGEIARAFRAASSSGKADSPSKFVKGGEVRQTGYHKKISATRYGASTRSDDLRRRLNELRSMRTGNPAHRLQHLGSQYGKHKK